MAEGNRRVTKTLGLERRVAAGMVHAASRVARRASSASGLMEPAAFATRQR